MTKRRKKSRGNNEGSIFHRADGRWVAQVSVIGPDGKRKLVPKYASTQAEARKLLTKVKTKQDAHRLVVTGKATVRDWLDLWLETFIKPNRAPRTYCSYHDVLKLHVPDSIGAVPLNKLAPETLQRHLNTITAAGHGRTAELLRAVLRSSFNRAVKLGRMESNPVLGTDSVQYESEETDTFTPEEGKRFIDATAEVRLGALYLIALSLGLRKGEVTGLKPEDVDLEKRELHVRRSLAWVKLPGAEEGHWVERPPKRGSVRDLSFTETIYRAVMRQLARRAEDAALARDNWHDSGYLFVGPTGAPLHHSNLSAAFHLLCKRAKVSRIRFHDTRHTCGTLLHLQGADPFVIQKVLGHSQLSTTKRYTHVPIEVTKAALGRVDALLTSAGKVDDSDPVTVNVTVKPETATLQ